MRRLQFTECLVLGLIIADAYASSALGQKSTRNSKLTVAMSQQVFEGLQQAQTLIESQQYSSGYVKLTELQEKPKLSPYETAQIWNLTAYAYYLQERYVEAIRAYENVWPNPRCPKRSSKVRLKH